MTGFEYAQRAKSIEEKATILILDAIKTAYLMAGKDFDKLTEAEKMEAINNLFRMEETK